MAISVTIGIVVLSAITGQAIQPPGPVSAVTCEHATDCVALSFGELDQSSMVSTDAGKTWSRRGELPQGAGYARLRCHGARCLAAGSVEPGTIATTSDLARHWSTALPNFESFGLACPNSSTCLAPGIANHLDMVAVTHDFGGSWDLVRLPVQGSMTDIWCTSTSDCSVSSLPHGQGQQTPVLETTSDGGATWATRPAAGPLNFASSCPDESGCVLVGHSIRATTDGGQDWSETSLPEGIGAFAVSCADRNHCDAGGDGRLLLFSADGGKTWRQPHVPSVPPVSVLSLFCARSGLCIATGSSTTSGAGWSIMRSTDFGIDWRVVIDGTPPDLLHYPLLPSIG